MTKLQVHDWFPFSSTQLLSKITNQDDHYYHNHGFYEIFYIVDGTIIHNYNGKSEFLEAGDVRLLRLSDKHSFERKDNVRCSHRDIIITEQQFKKSCNFIDETLFERINNEPQPLKAKLQQSKLTEFEKELSKMFFISSTQGFQTKETMANVLSIDLVNVFLQEFNPQYSGLPSWLNAILPFFSNSIYMKAGLDTILSGVNYDKSYICRIFKKYMHCTMTQYLHERRIDYATTLLLTTDKTIAQICEEIGILSIPYFTMSFKNKYQLSPKQFKIKFFNTP